ncbi:uncharacterized protein [Glycine max]|uniref:uncharacterized protein n=1 Tax=Glycine max TaxID=3847 RepID=UPI000E21B3DC|nr:uncharacterized protein LOC113002420 [Glycine max]|eukprot:XP_025985627.1 uncharacterized protein LOC113002420 [Glycine max]
MLHRDGNPAYLDTVNRIWRCRVRHKDVSGERSLLLLPELERWRSDIEASLLDSQVLERLASIDTTKIEKCTAASEEVHPSTAAEEVHPSTAAEVQKVRRECDSVELQYLSKDSLLNSLEVNETPIEEQSRDADVPCPHVINNNDPDLMEKDLTSVPRNDYHRPSLMERNSTTPISEWNDSIDGLEGGTSDHAIRCHLPSPKGTKVSPLTKYKPTKITRSRKTKRWSQLEEETRKTAVDKFGRGKWKLMLDSNKDIFKERTEVDLNDKWRSMTRLLSNMNSGGYV